MIASVPSATLLGVTGQPVIVEVHSGVGVPGFQIVGSPDAACRESRDRVRAALLSSGLAWPNRRITVNLAPSGIRKAGAGLDLAIAIALLVADEQLPPEIIERYAFVGELGLDGSLRGMPGVAPMVACRSDYIAVVPSDAYEQATAIGAADVRCAPTLAEVVSALAGAPWPDPPPPASNDLSLSMPDLADVRGQPDARLALELAAAGGHHLLLVGPPGAGKTMLAQRLPGLLPALDPVAALEATMVYSAAGVSVPGGGVVRQPTFRAPHHSSSMVALVGGGSTSLRPGEVSLAHGGVLFLDELGEFPAHVLDALRQPLEEGVIRVSRANSTATLPARFQMIAASNPCPCGGGAPGECECDLSARMKYFRRISGPFLDRFDLRVSVGAAKVDDLLGRSHGEPTAVVRERVMAARALALRRAGKLNASLSADELEQYAPLDHAAESLVRREFEANRLTGRGLHRVRRVALTLGDLGLLGPGTGSEPGTATIGVELLTVALQLRVTFGSSARVRVA
jgi:magnesium chelatase family protein